jgi:predicted CXXCH cytochrome family protein
MRSVRRVPVTLASLAAAALVACAGATQPGRIPDKSAPPPSAFETYPAAEVAALKSPHQYKGKPLCQRCHGPDLALAAQPNALCKGCHRLPHGNHPTDVVQKAPSGNLPLLAEGKVACHTCHDPHTAKVVLRKPFNALCRDCHKGH